MDEQIEPLTEVGAAEAFAALQDEITSLGQKLEELAAGPNVPEAVDYGPSFGEVLGKLAQLETTLAGIAPDPSLRLTPDQHARVIERAKEGAFQEVIRQLRDEAGAIRREREALGEIGTRGRNRKRQRLWLAVQCWSALWPIRLSQSRYRAGAIWPRWRPGSWTDGRPALA